MLVNIRENDGRFVVLGAKPPYDVILTRSRKRDARREAEKRQYIVTDEVI